MDSYGNEERERPEDALASWKRKIKPTKAEWDCVQNAATAIAQLIEFKATIGGEYNGKSAWEIIEDQVGEDQLRFHKLCTLATLQYAVWIEEKVKALKVHTTRYKPEVIDRIRWMRKEGASMASIAAKVGASENAVGRIVRELAGMPKPRPPKKKKTL